MQPETSQPYIQDQPQFIEGEVPVKSDELYAAQIQEDRIKNLIYQISPDHQLLELQWRIKGYIKNPATGLWSKLNKDSPEPSPLLVSRYISYLSGILNQNTTLSNLSSGEINNIMKLIIEWLVDDLDANSEIYDLGKDYSERTRIGSLLLNTTFMVLKRAQNGMESRRIFKALSVTENLSAMPQQGGLKEALKFWK